MKLPILFALGTAICWGLYGPTLGKARAADLSPFKPYVSIGVAYLVWAIVGGLIGMWYKGDSFSFTGSGSAWGFAAGTLGAWGAFNLTLAMFSGGGAMPHIVMPVVFGGAVSVAAISSVVSLGGTAKVSPMLWVGILGMAVCIVIVAANTPHGPGPAKKKTEQASEVPADSSDSKESSDSE
jgi:hypothetical protein